MDWLTVILVVTALLLLMFLTRRPKDFPPGPFNIPLLGNLPIIIIYYLTKADTAHEVMWALARQYGPVMALYLGRGPAIVVTGYKAVKKVLSSDDFSFRPTLISGDTKCFGRRKGVFFTDGPEWREQRRFSLRNLRDFGFGRRSMETLIHEEARALISVVDQAISDPKFNILPLLPVTAINVLWTIMAGQRHDLDNHGFQKLTNTVLAFFRSGTAIDWSLQRIPILNASHKKRLALADEIIQFIENTILEHEATFDENHMRDFMDVYIKEMRDESHSSFTKDQLCAICMDLFVAGTETTSSTISYALRYMVQYPKVQDELRNELQRVVGTERLPAMDDVPKLHYTQAVVAEILRHSGLVSLSPPHTTQKDVDLMGYRIPKGTFIIANLWSVHMDPEHWGDPKNFRPDRFLDQDGAYKKTEFFMPFGDGPRTCLGEPLARYSVLLFLTALVQHFRFEPRGAVPSYKQQAGLVTAPAPFNMTITRI